MGRRHGRNGTAARSLLAGLAAAVDDVFVGGELAKAHWASCVELLVADSDLGSEAKFVAVGEACGGVDVYTCGVELACESGGGSVVFGDDRFAVAGAVSGDVREGFVDSVDHLD